MGPKRLRRFFYKREAEGDFIKSLPDHRGRDWRDAVTGPGMLTSQKLEEARDGIFPAVSGECSPATQRPRPLLMTLKF